MSNMSYCKFQNTLRDLRDCRYTLKDFVDRDSVEVLSDDELEAANDLILECTNIVQMISEVSEFSIEDVVESSSAQKQIVEKISELNLRNQNLRSEEDDR